MSASVLLSRPEHVLAAVPHLLGFHPQRSVVIMWMHEKLLVLVQRVDLPETNPESGDIREWAAHVCSPQRTITSDAALVVFFVESVAQSSDSAFIVGALLEALCPPVLDVLYAGPDGWRDSLERTHPWDRVSADSAALGFTGEPLASREALSLAPVGAIKPPSRNRVGRHTERTCIQILTASMQSECVVSDHELSAVLRGLRSVSVRDHVGGLLLDSDPSQASAAWAELVMRSPSGYAAPLATLTALAAWLAGDGARAWCAIDRALADEPGYVMAELMHGIVSAPVPPATVREWLTQFRPTFAHPA